MKYLLDSNACIELLRGRGDSIRERLNAEGEANTVVCSVVRFELLAGAIRSRQPERNLPSVHTLLSRFLSVPFNDAAADIAAEVNATLASAGAPIGINDILIASIARANDLTLVTHNTSEFLRVPGLRVEDWQTPGPPR